MSNELMRQRRNLSRSLQKILFPRLSWPLWAACSPTNTQRVILVNGIMAAASMTMWSALPAIGLQTFRRKFANVQPHSGAQAN